MAYFSTWRPHENQVSKTRFTTLINIEHNQRIRENPEKKKKKKKNQKNPEQRNPGSARPGSCATWAMRCLGFFHLGSMRPRSRATQATRAQAMHNPGHTKPRPRWWGISDEVSFSEVFLVRWALDSFSLSLIFWSNWIFFFFWVFRLVHGQLET